MTRSVGIMQQSTAQMAASSNVFATGLREAYGRHDPRIVACLVEAIKPMLGGFAPVIQSATLADLTAIWLAGFQGSDAAEVRAEYLDGFVALTKDLIAPNEQALMAQIPPAGSA
jgi:hypothetical protein